MRLSLCTPRKTTVSISLSRYYSNHPHSTLNIQPLPLEHEDTSNFYARLLQSHPQTHPTQQIHAKTIINGTHRDSFISTHLIKSYAKLQHLSTARLVFNSVIHKKRVFIWNAMIRAYSVNESWKEIAHLYSDMLLEQVQPDHYTFPFVIKSYAVLDYVEQGKGMHELVVRYGLIDNMYIATALMEMYIKFGDMSNAFKLFDEMPERDVVAWTSIISGYVENGCDSEALRVFEEMRGGDGDGDVKPNWVTVLCLIPACNRWIHSLVVKCGFDSAAEVETALLNMYVKVGDVGSACSLFDWMSERNLVSWTVMVSGYSQNGHAHEALRLFYEMMHTAEVKLDAVIAACVLNACAQIGSLSYGEMIHGYAAKIGLVTQLEVETSLVDMYAKCGCLNVAQRVFDGIRNPNIITWSALISGYGCHGFGSKALDVFQRMKGEGVVPDETAFLGVLSACSHAGLVREGKEFFNLMKHEYKLSPEIKHYACMIDLLGRAGLVEEAWDLMKSMPFEPDTEIWGILLSACKIKGNVRIAEHAYRRLMELDCDNTEYHVLLANIYAACGKWNEVSKVRSVTRKKGENKTPGCSYIVVNSKIHSFFAGDKSHPESKNLNIVVEMLHPLMVHSLDAP